MRFEIGRLRGGEWIVGGASVALLIALFALPWFGLKAAFAPTRSTLGGATNYDGYTTFPVIRWLIFLVVVAGLATWWFQATRRAPALPVSMTVVTVTLGTLLLLSLIYRVLIHPPQLGIYTEMKYGAYAGLILAAVVLVGTYLSLREDGIREADGPGKIETLRLAQRPA